MRRRTLTGTPASQPTGAIPYMSNASKPSPRIALMRWLAQIHYNSVRNIETVDESVTQTDSTKPLRGFRIAEDLVLTRKRTFYRIVGDKATPLSVEEVSANYNLEAMQAKYRSAVEVWKNIQRNRNR